MARQSTVFISSLSIVIFLFQLQVGKAQLFTSTYASAKSAVMSIHQALKAINPAWFSFSDPFFTGTFFTYVILTFFTF